MFSHICNPNGWPLRRHKTRGQEDPRRHSWGSDSDFLNAVPRQPGEDVLDAPPDPEPHVSSPSSPATSSAEDSDNDQPHSTTNSKTSFSGSGSSLESAGVLLRATHDLDLVGTCRSVDQVLLERRRRLRRERRSHLAENPPEVQEEPECSRETDSDDMTLKHCALEQVEDHFESKVAVPTTKPSSKVSLTWALCDKNTTPLVSVSEKKVQSRETVLSSTLSAIVKQIPPTSEVSQFGYDIQDVDIFLSAASKKHPANIPMVVSYQCVLQKTLSDKSHSPEEMQLQLGMVVNAICKREDWLYIQTPHGEEGHVTYKACMPLGIIPSDEMSSQPWEVFSDPAKNKEKSATVKEIPKTILLNKTDSEKLYENLAPKPRSALLPACQKLLHSLTEESRKSRSRPKSSSEKSRGNNQQPDSKECGIERIQGPLVTVNSDYNSKGRNALSVSKGEKVTVLNNSLKDWYWVRNGDGKEGFIPSAVAGQGFL